MTEEKEASKPDYEEEEYENNLLRWMSIAVVALTVTGFIALAWYAYRSGTESVSPEEVPLIEANNGDVKEAPANPGGMQFPNQDKTIYDAMSGNAPKPAAERILPAPEEPVAVTPDNSSEGAETWVNEKLYDKGKAESSPATPPKAEAKSEPKEEAAMEPKPTEAKPAAESEPAEAKPAKVAPKAEPKAAESKPATRAEAKTSGSTRVQLAAFGSEAEATAQWKKISAKYDVLQGKSHTVVKADLPKGTFYRLQVTGLKDRAAAAALCATLKSKGQSCIVASQ
jgi:cell division septation protein DedD